MSAFAAPVLDVALPTVRALKNAVKKVDELERPVDLVLELVGEEFGP